MKESVHHTNHPWLVGLAVAAVAGAYFYFSGADTFDEPGPNLDYNVEQYAKLDHINTRYAQVAEITPELEHPNALAVTADALYVAGTNAIVKYDANDIEIERYTIEGTPSCIAIAADGAMFLGQSNHVEVLNADGTPQTKWEPYNERSFITAIAATDDDVYIADAGNRLVVRYDRNGEIQARIGEKDLDRDVPGIEVPSPYLDLAINDEGHLWVVNPGKLGLERYREDGEIVTSWYHPTLELYGFAGCCNPTQIAFTKDGRLVTCEKGLVRVKIYEVTAGEFEELVVGSREFPRGSSVRDMAVDHRDRILVIDPRTETIRAFAMKETDDVQTQQAD